MKQFTTFLVGLFFGCLLSYGIHRSYCQPHTQLIKEIDTFYVYRDSIQAKIDTIYIDRIKLKHIYEQKDTVIWNQSANDDWDFYLNYLRSRFPSDSTATQAD